MRNYFVPEKGAVRDRRFIFGLRWANRSSVVEEFARIGILW